MTEPTQPPFPPTPKYSITHQGNTQGPFERDFIEAMVLAKVYPPQVMVQKVGSTEWVPFNSLGGSVPNPPIQPQAQFPGPASPPSSEIRKSKKHSEAAIALVVGVFVVLVVIWIVVADHSSKKPPTSKATSSPAPTRTRSSQPVLTSPSPARLSPAYSAPSTSATPPADSTVYRDASGRTFRVSNSDYLRLSAMQTSLSLKQSRLQLEEERLSALAAEVDRERITLDRYNQYSVDAFNRKVNQVNSMNDRVQSLVNDYNRDVDAFNAELERVGTPIN